MPFNWQSITNVGLQTLAENPGYARAAAALPLVGGGLNWFGGGSLIGGAMDVAGNMIYGAAMGALGHTALSAYKATKTIAGTRGLAGLTSDIIGLKGATRTTALKEIGSAAWARAMPGIGRAALMGGVLYAGYKLGSSLLSNSPVNPVY